jgi:hypothetical protein
MMKDSQVVGGNRPMHPILFELAPEAMSTAKVAPAN